jgi:hypothetical protein
MPDCTTCQWIKWSASIPLFLLLGAGGFLLLAQIAVVRTMHPLFFSTSTWRPGHMFWPSPASHFSQHGGCGSGFTCGLHMRFGHVEGIRRKTFHMPIALADDKNQNRHTHESKT